MLMLHVRASDSCDLLIIVIVVIMIYNHTIAIYQIKSMLCQKYEYSRSKHDSIEVDG